MSAEEVLKQFELEGKREEDHLYRFLSNLYRLFDNRLPPTIESNIQELLALLEKKETVKLVLEYLETA
jgi:hypothetical protein